MNSPNPTAPKYKNLRVKIKRTKKIIILRNLFLLNMEIIIIKNSEINVQGQGI